MNLIVDSSKFLCRGYRFRRFIPMDDFIVRRWPNRYLQPVVGAPLAAEADPPDSTPLPRLSATHFAATQSPGNAFVRFAEPPRASGDKSINADMKTISVKEDEIFFAPL
jgi:hypothetical protein